MPMDFLPNLMYPGPVEKTMNKVYGTQGRSLFILCDVAVEQELKDI